MVVKANANVKPEPQLWMNKEKWKAYSGGWSSQLTGVVQSAYSFRNVSIRNKQFFWSDIPSTFPWNFQTRHPKGSFTEDTRFESITPKPDTLFLPLPSIYVSFPMLGACRWLMLLWVCTKGNETENSWFCRVLMFMSFGRTVRKVLLTLSYLQSYASLKRPTNSVTKDHKPSLLENFSFPWHQAQRSHSLISVHTAETQVRERIFLQWSLEKAARKTHANSLSQSFLGFWQW